MGIDKNERAWLTKHDQHVIEAVKKLQGKKEFIQSEESICYDCQKDNDYCCDCDEGDFYISPDAYELKYG